MDSRFIFSEQKSPDTQNSDEILVPQLAVIPETVNELRAKSFLHENNPWFQDYFYNSAF
jgi:hypothetical protein